MRAILLIIISIFIISNSYAKETKIITSIKPIYLIAKEIVSESEILDLLVPANNSPHHYNLRPSDLSKLHESDLVFIIDYNFEKFLKKMEIDGNKLVTISKYENINLLKKRNNDKIDYHLWLSPENAIKIAEIIKERLSSINPAKQSVYENNYNNFRNGLIEKVSIFKDKLKTANINNFIIFHDAYLYAEKYFDLKEPSYVMHLHDNDQITMKKLLKLKEIISKENVKCIFKEPQFSDKIINSLAEDHKIKIGILDPIGVEASSYSDMLSKIIDSFLSCQKN